MVVAGTKDAVLMVESEANELPEDIMLGAVLYAHQEMQAVIQAINELVKDSGKEAWVWEPTPVNEELTAAVKKDFEAPIGYATHLSEHNVKNSVGTLMGASKSFFTAAVNSSLTSSSNSKPKLT